MAGFRTFATGEVLTAANVNNFLMKQSVMVFADASARTAALGAEVAEGMLTYNEDTEQLEVFDGSAFVLAAPAPPAGIGSNVVSVTKTDFFAASVASTAGEDVTGLTVTITPTSATSKMLVSWTLTGSRSSAGTEGSLSGRCLRDGTNVGVGTESSRTAIGAGMLIVAGNAEQFATASQTFLDAPATTDPVVYKLQVVNNADVTASLFVNRSPATISRAPTAGSSLTVIEVAA